VSHLPHWLRHQPQRVVATACQWASSRFYAPCWRAVRACPDLRCTSSAPLGPWGGLERGHTGGALRRKRATNFALDIARDHRLLPPCAQSWFRDVQSTARPCSGMLGQRFGEGQPSQAVCGRLQNARPWKIIRIEKFSHSAGRTHTSSGFRYCGAARSASQASHGASRRTWCRSDAGRLT